uniref:ERBB receptor feedback inhibitor 1 n=1 Tax=Monopterus albus TaxID=43700 RepID=UPI0009B3D4DB|nr:ERBB receptor feedback inhibitor 1-like [Monopterus albus]XP_020475850.1 ERBB receptor feedback inhibitor 1-like [Monopterus albus]XP_020475858.1 ERBB receptor feedback inhibitor 1-like [Monopterus albus]
MAGNQKSYWGQHDLNRVCFGLSDDTEHSPTQLQQRQTAKEFNSSISLPQSPFYSGTYRLTSDNMLQPHEGDQVVPSSQRRTVFGDHQRQSKPLPPLPDPEELMSDEAADNEVEFFTSDRQRLLPKSCPKAICRGSNRDRGQVNRAYQESFLQAGGAGIVSMAFSWPGREDRGGGFGANNWEPAFQGEDYQHVVSAVGDPLCRKQPDQQQLSRFRFSCSGSAFRPHSSIKTCTTDKPQVPPRIPIERKPPALPKTTEEDKPPKIPPRVPLVPPCPPRTPSPKSLPIYINGVMPATQSFAANPEYVSKALQRQQRERAPPPGQFSPCIVPILKDGRQASATHYILLPPGRPAYTDRRERLHSEPARTENTSVWQNR